MSARGPRPPSARPAEDPSDGALLDRLQREAFDHFMLTMNPQNGLIADTTRPDAPSSIAAVGFALSAYPVGVERGWIERAEAVQRTLLILRFFLHSDQSGAPDATGYRGFYYHFLDMRSGTRAWLSELSLIDTALLIAGALTAANYFTAPTPAEGEVRELAETLYRRVDWRWAQADGATLMQGWKPESGFLHYGWEGYSEAILLYVLGLGSPTHPLTKASFDAWTVTYQWENLYGRDFLYAGPLFIHQFSHAWIDFRGIRDRFMREKDCDYFENSRRATYVQREYAARNPGLAAATHTSAGACAAPGSAAVGYSRMTAVVTPLDPHPAFFHPHEGAHDRDLCHNVRPLAWRNPHPRGPYHLLVIGAGMAGLVAARAAAALGAKVALVERDLLGGNFLNYGCLPSKPLIRTSRVYAEMREAERYGAQRPDDIKVDFPMAMERMRRLRARLSRTESAASLSADGIDLFFGAARFVSGDAVDVDGVRLRFNKAMIATGSRSRLPTIPGLADAGYLTNETVFDLTEPPASLLVIGGGPIGCEMAQAFSRFGVRTTIVHAVPLFLPKEERDAAQMVSDSLARDGVGIHLNTQAVNVRVEAGKIYVDTISDGVTATLEVDRILTGIGRSPTVDGLNLEAAGVAYDREAGVRVDDFLRTTNRRIYAAGDVCLEHKFTNTAAASARIVVRNALLLGRKRFSALTIPWCTYTDPEIAHVGIYVRQAREQGIPVKTFTVPMHTVDRAIVDGEEDGFAKIHVREGTGKILGATVVARHAGEMINGITLAMVAGVDLGAMARVIHAYPTQADAIKMAADAYARSRRSPFIGAVIRRWINR